MTGPRAVVISLPARDEADVIEACLSGVAAAVRHAVRLGLVNAAVVVVAAHRCADDTAPIAARWRRESGLTADILVDGESATVGMVRDRAARRGLDLIGAGMDPTRTWVLSTDADTVVGPEWITQILDVADRHRASCVVGLAALDEWRGSNEGLAAYDALLLAKFRDHAGGDEHDHVYGANLAVRADAYLAVGGFPHCAHGEDQQLVDTLASSGVRIARSRAVTVTTSGRTSGRAVNGLADLLWRLDDPTPATRRRPSRQLSGTNAGPPLPLHNATQHLDLGPDPEGLQDAANVRI